MKKLTFVLLSALAMTAIAMTPSEGDKSVPAIDKNNFDESINRNDDFYQWAIVLKELNEPIGVIGVVDRNESLNMLHIEYCIGHSGNVMKKCGLVYEGTLR